MSSWISSSGPLRKQLTVKYLRWQMVQLNSKKRWKTHLWLLLMWQQLCQQWWTICQCSSGRLRVLFLFEFDIPHTFNFSENSHCNSVIEEIVPLHCIIPSFFFFFFQFMLIIKNWTCVLWHKQGGRWRVKRMIRRV